MGRRQRKGRNISGILLLDKPIGLSSNDALQKVKSLYRASKAGHTGSLDPLATGMLPICFGSATKISGFLLDADKQYQMTCRLGEKTSTGDAEGEVIETRAVQKFSTADIELVLKKFLGEIEQIPPMYSALKHQGERLYNLARQGLEVERAPRTVQIYDLRLLSHREQELDLEVSCSKGTYVRTLVEDIGEALGCGAHVTVLRRIGVGPFKDPSRMITLEKIREYSLSGTDALDALLLPVDDALCQWPDVHLTSDSSYYFQQGQAVQVPKAPVSGWVRIYDQAENFIGMGQVQDDGKIAPKRLFGASQG